MAVLLWNWTHKISVMSASKKRSSGFRMSRLIDTPSIGPDELMCKFIVCDTLWSVGFGPFWPQSFPKNRAAQHGVHNVTCFIISQNESTMVSHSGCGIHRCSTPFPPSTLLALVAPHCSFQQFGVANFKYLPRKNSTNSSTRFRIPGTQKNGEREVQFYASKLEENII